MANRDNCSAQGTVAPVLAVLHRMAICSPHVREQRPTWWQIIGEEGGQEHEPGSEPAEINLRELGEHNRPGHICVHVCTPTEKWVCGHITIYISSMYSAVYREPL